MSAPRFSPRVSPDGKWWWDGSSWRPIAYPALRAARRAFDWAVVGMLCWLALPVSYVVLLGVVNPGLFGPLFSTPGGVVLLAVGFVAIGISVALAEVARRVTRPTRGGLLVGLGLILAAIVVQFFALWIILLGPAMLIVLNRSPA